MTCEKCKKQFNPTLEEVKVLGGYEDTVEVGVTCPHCEANYSHWIAPTDWNLQGE